MHLDPFCKSVADMSERINTVVVMRETITQGAYAKPGQWVPDKDLLDQLLTQVLVLTGIAHSNEQIYGEVGYVMVTHKLADFFFFPASDRILLVSVNRPYSHNELESMVAEKLAELKKMTQV